MKLPRRKFLHLAAGIAAVPAMARIARAQAYPTGPVRLIVGFPAGGTNFKNFSGSQGTFDGCQAFNCGDRPVGGVRQMKPLSWFGAGSGW